MLETIDKFDQTLFLILNNFHVDWLDATMWFISGKKEWIPFYLLIVVVLFRKYGWYGFAVLAAVGVAVLFTDQFSSGFCKPFFERLRPSHNPDLIDQVYILNNYRGGKYGFISSHAANSFGIATILYCVLRYQLTYSWVLFLWAGVVSYSRIYLGVHYPGDILAGTAAGIFLGWVTFLLLKKALSNTSGYRLLFTDR